LLKSTIRISFINECVKKRFPLLKEEKKHNSNCSTTSNTKKGLREAGIDQDGVFKEFLQDVVKQLLDPKFNLFQVTSEQQFYPSSSSYFIDDHLQMFEFAGKMIGKSIYEVYYESGLRISNLNYF
jgi:hypothetical protein